MFNSIDDVLSFSFSKCSTFPSWNIKKERFTFERIHNTKEQIYFYERAENQKAKERLFESFNRANFPGKHPDAGADQGFLERGFICIKDVGFISFIINIQKYPMKMK